MLEGGPSDPGYADVSSGLVPVVAGDEYTFGGRVRLLSGTDAYKLSLHWYDAEGSYLGFSNDWRSVRWLDGHEWTAAAGTAPRCSSRTFSSGRAAAPAATSCRTGISAIVWKAGACQPRENEAQR